MNQYHHPVGSLSSVLKQTPVVNNNEIQSAGQNQSNNFIGQIQQQRYNPQILDELKAVGIISNDMGEIKMRPAESLKRLQFYQKKKYANTI